MHMRYRLIDNGNVVGEQLKEFGGNRIKNVRNIEKDVFDGMDPLQLARAGKRITWVEATPA